MSISARGIFSSSALILILLITGCGSGDISESDTENPAGASMPNLKGVSAESAEQIVLRNNWIPRIYQEPNSTIPEGQVTRTNPSEGTLLEPNSSVSIYVSTGPAVIYAKDSLIAWANNSSDLGDEWNFETPFISNDTLKINLIDVSLSIAIDWKDSTVNGMGLGRASITDTFDKTVPISFYCGKCVFEKQEMQNLELEIPLGDLDVDQPTQIFVELYEEDFVVKLNFNITW